MATKTFQLSEIFQFLPKSHRKAGDGLGSGLYRFFTSSQLQTKWFDEADYSSEAIILGTGGAPSIHCADNFSTSADTFIIAPKNKNVLAKYVYYFLSGNRDILDRGFKGAGLRHLSKEYTEKIQVPFPVDKNGNPDLVEQKRIVVTLEEAESLKKKRAEADQKMNELIPALFNKMFGDLSKYPVKKLGDFCQVTTGNTPSRAKDEFYGSAIEWIKTDNFFEYSLYPSPAKEGLSEIGAKIARIVSENSILMTCIAGSIKSIGNVCLTNRQVAFNQQINALTIKDNTNPLFLYWFLRINKSKTQKLASHVLKFIINKTRLEGLVVSIPPVTLQNQFVEKVKEIESQKEKQKQSAIQLDVLFSSLLSRLFSGELSKKS